MVENKINTEVSKESLASNMVTEQENESISDYIDWSLYFDNELAENIKAISGLSNFKISTTNFDEDFEDKPIAVLFFTVDAINNSNKDSDYMDSDYAKLVNEGGCIEIYKDADIATSRNAYLIGFYIFGLTGGKHESVNNYVIQTSNALSAEDQEHLLTELSNILLLSNSEATENSDETSGELETVFPENQTIVPAAAYMLNNDDVNDVVELFNKAGFTNVQTQAIYDLEYTNVWSSAKLDWVESVSINENVDFKGSDIFEKDAPVIVSYHAFEKDNPNITYKEYTISELFEDLESNPMRAKDEHLYEYIEIAGKISEISPHGKYILLCETDDIYGLNFIYCGTETTEFIDHVYNLSKGDIVKVRGKINVVNTIYDYTMDVYSFQ